MKWYFAALKKVAECFEGRARRKEFWMFSLFYCIVGVALVVLDGIILVSRGVIRVMQTTPRQTCDALLSATAVACLLSVGVANAQEARRGFYVGVNAGLANALAVDSSVTAVTTPTKCDTLLYTDPALAPSGAPECRDTTPKALSSTGFSPGPGFTGGVSAGYALNPLRVEFEYRARTQGDDASALLGSRTNQVVVSKANEWSPVYPPTETVSGYRAHQFFATLHIDFANAPAGRLPWGRAPVWPARACSTAGVWCARRSPRGISTSIRRSPPPTARPRPPARSACWSPRLPAPSSVFSWWAAWTTPSASAPPSASTPTGPVSEKCSRMSCGRSSAATNRCEPTARRRSRAK